VFKLSPTSSHTRSKSLSPLSNCCINSIIGQRSRLATFLASIKSCARRFSLLMILLTDVSEMHVWRAICPDFCGYLSQYFGSEPDHQLRRLDFISNTRSAWATAAQGWSHINSTSTVDFADHFFKPPNDHCYFLLNILIYLLPKLAQKVKSHWKKPRGPDFMKNGVV